MCSVCCLWQNNSVSPSDSLRVASEKHRSSSDYGLDSKKRKVEDKDSNRGYVSVCVYYLGVCVWEEFMALQDLEIHLEVVLTLTLSFLKTYHHLGQKCLEKQGSMKQEDKFTYMLP